MVIADKYEVVKELGRGAFGIVYEAVDQFLDRRVAIKVVGREAFTSEASREEFEKRFLREARAAARMNHPSIVAVFDAGRTEDGQSYLVMEYVAGSTLRAILDDRGALPIADATGYLSQLLGALDYAHGRGIVHRDIKPENLMIRDDGVLKVADFGVARILQEGQTTMTREGMAMGTPCYMSPEQILSKPVDGRADLFAAAAIMFEMLVGHKAFDGGTIPAVMYKILSEPAPRVSEHVEVPEAVEQAIQKGLGKKAEQRFSSGTEFLEALKSHAPTALLPRTTGGTSRAEVMEAAKKRTPPSDATSGPVATGTMAFQWVPASPSKQPDLEGDFARTPIPELLLKLKSERETGMLVVETADWFMGVDLKDGSPFGVCGGPPRTALGPTLKRMGIVGNETYARLHTEFRKQVQGESPARFGVLAVRMGAVSGAQLVEVLQAQVDARIDALVAVSDGSYRLYRGQHTGEWSSMDPRPIEALVHKSLEVRPSRADELVSRFLKTQGAGRFTVSDTAPSLLGAFKLGPRIQRLLNSMNGRLVDEALDSSIVSRRDAGLALYLLWAAGGVSVSQEAGAARAGAGTYSRAGGVPAPRPDANKPKKRPTVTYLPRVVHGGGEEVNTAVRLATSQLLARAEQALENREFDQAVDFLKKAREQDPRNPTVLARLGWSMFRRQPGLAQARDQAKQMLEASLALDPRALSALVSLARVYRVEDNLYKARLYIERALAIDPDAADARLESEAIERLRRKRGERAD